MNSNNSQRFDYERPKLYLQQVFMMGRHTCAVMSSNCFESTYLSTFDISDYPDKGELKRVYAVHNLDQLLLSQDCGRN